MIAMTNADCVARGAVAGNGDAAQCYWPECDCPRAATFTSTDQAYEAGLERAALWHDAEAEKFQRRLDRQATRRDVPGFRGNVGGRSVSFSGTEVSQYREALQDEISSHQISARNIRALKSPAAAEPSPATGSGLDEAPQRQPEPQKDVSP